MLKVVGVARRIIDGIFLVLLYIVLDGFLVFLSWDNVRADLDGLPNC